MLTARHALAVLASVAILFLIYFLLDNKPPSRTVYDDMADQLVDSLPEQIVAEIKTLNQRLNKASKSSQKTDLYLDLANEWESIGRLHISSEYFRKYAELKNDADIWVATGNRFYELTYNTEDENLRVNSVFRGIYSFEKGLELMGHDNEVKLKLASLYTDGTNDVMKGIFMLREVAEEDPTNMEANFRLGRFATMSGQFDKAAQRFERVLQKDSLNLQARYLLAESYLGMNEKQRAIQTLEKGLSLAKDSLVKEEYEKNINKLKE